MHKEFKIDGPKGAASFTLIAQLVWQISSKNGKGGRLKKTLSRVRVKTRYHFHLFWWDETSHVEKVYRQPKLTTELLWWPQSGSVSFLRSPNDEQFHHPQKWDSIKMACHQISFEVQATFTSFQCTLKSNIRGCKTDIWQPRSSSALGYPKSIKRK